jgi:hypothetical protein
MEFGPSVVPELREILLSTGEGEFTILTAG